MFTIYLKHVYDIYVYTNTQRLCSCVLATKSSVMTDLSMLVKKGLDCIKIGKVWSIRVCCIRRFGNLSSRLHVSNSETRTLFDWKRGVSVFHSCNIRIGWGLWSQSNFHDMIISIINIFWLHWIINRLVVMHPYALSHNKAVLNWNNFVWSIRPILIQGLIACRSNKQQPADAVS